jgi:hypothetical protein
MSISNEAIIAIATAVTANATVLQTLVNSLPREAQAKVTHIAMAPTAIHITPTPAPAPAPIATVTPIQAAVIPVAAPVAQVAAMPPPPSFQAPVAAPAATGAPFTDAKGLLEWVMKSYKEMGSEKGAGIQGVLVSLGYNNINDVNPMHYAALYQGVESLKG